MIKTSKELDFSSIITQVPRDDDHNRQIPLTATVVNSGASQTKTDTKSNS